MDNKIINSVKEQIKEHPWPWMAGVFVIGLVIGLIF